jgi:hypothetical protein
LPKAFYHLISLFTASAAKFNPKLAVTPIKLPRLVQFGGSLENTTLKSPLKPAFFSSYLIFLANGSLYVFHMLSTFIAVGSIF